MFKYRSLVITNFVHEGVEGYRVETDSRIFWKKFDRFGCPQIEQEIHKVRVYFLLSDQLLFRQGKPKMAEGYVEKMRKMALDIRSIRYANKGESDG